jgi:anthranilate synthase component 1/para-aminobenzoate synthetase
LAVTIRTLVTVTEAGDCAEATADLTLGVGGAITSDSIPDEEYEEIQIKAFGILSVLGAEFPSDG